MSLQSTNGNHNIAMIPANDDKVDEEPSSSSTLKGEPVESTKILTLSNDLSLEKENEVETQMESESINDDTKALETENDVTIVKANEKLNNRSINCSKMRIKTSGKRNWGISHGRVFTQNKNKNGYKRSGRRNIRMQNKRLVTVIPEKSAIEITNFEVDQQKSEDKLSELCTSSTDCIACKEKFLDRLELHKHTMTAHPDVPIKFCDLCDDTFFNENDLQNHVLIVHGESPKIIEEQNELDRLNILKDLEEIEECPSENNLNNTQETNELINESENRMYINIEDGKISTETLEFVEKTATEPIESFSHAVKVQIAEGGSDIFTYTALNEKKEYCSKDYVDCHGMNEISVVECEWATPKNDNLSENIEDSMLTKSEIREENCLTSSMEEFQDIEELENSCEVEEKNEIQPANQTENEIQPADQIENENYACNKNDIQLIYDIANTSIIESIELMDTDQHDESLILQLNDKSGNDSNTTLSSPKSSSSSICRTYSSKSNSQVLKKPLSIINIPESNEDEINFCIMCREIFSLIEQKSVNTNSGTESIFKCPLCSRQFVSRSSLEKHVAYYHLNCECTKISQSPSTIVSEVLTSPILYECVLCPTTFNTYNGLNNHILTLHEPMPPFKDRLTIGKPEYLRTVRCTYMESKLSSTKNKNNSGNVSIINCPNCELTFNTCDDYILHIKELHNNMMPIEDNSQISIETTQSFDNISHSSMDINTEPIEMNISRDDLNENVNSSEVTKKSNELRKTCKRCNKEFETVRDLSEHFYFSHDDTIESQTIMATASSTDKRTHDWRCLHCSQRFKMLQSYIRHRYFVHNDESMVHVCENCCKILTSITMVNAHVCLNVTSWVCKPCNESFRNGVELRLHNTEKHLETPGSHTCPACEKRFLTMAMLIRHRETKKCYPRVRPPEKSNVIQNQSNKPSTTKRLTVAKKSKSLSPVKKIKEEFPRVQDLPNMRVIQEDVFIREARDKNNLQNPNYNLTPTSSNLQQNDEIYQCSMCKLYFLSKSGLKVHLSRAHTSAVEICQLCYKMFVTGNLVRHITDNHLKHDSNNQAYYKALRVKQHNTFQINEHDIEKDTEELISTIGITQLLGLCEYQRFTEQSDDNDRFCPDCPLTFDNSEKYRRHYVQTHDKLCALCNMEFETGQDASRHKTRIHGSMACYVWFAHKLIAAISDTKTFSEMAEKIITDTVPVEMNEHKMEIEENVDFSNYIKEEEINSISDKSDEWVCNSEWGENYSSRENSFNENPITLIDVNHIESEPVEDDDEDEYKLFILVSEDDLEKYKDDISELARQIYSTCNIFSIEQIEAMLEPYAKQ